MADKILNSGAIDTTDPSQLDPLAETWHDNGDGTFARQLFIGTEISVSGIGGVTVADGADAVLGALADAAVQGDTAGTLGAKIRGLNKLAGTSADNASAPSLFGFLLNIKNAVANLLPKGQATMANSSPVVIASNQSAVPVTAGAGTNLNTSALALETGGNLATLATHLPAKGQAAMAASLPVVVASDQSAVPVTSTDVDSYAQAHDFTSNSGAGPTLDMSAGKGLVYSAQITADGTVTSFSVTVEGSLDGTNWATMLTLTNSSPGLNGIGHATAEPLAYLRSNCGALVLNSATKITVNLLALR